MANERENCDREVIHLHIGSGGIEIGHQCWQLYGLEHSLDADGYTLDDKRSPRCFFSEWDDHDKKHYRPRALFLDHDSTIIDRIKTSHLKNFYHENQFFLSPDLLLNNIRKQTEHCDHFQGFIVSHSTYGSSTNVTSKLLYDLINEYPKMTILTNSIFDSSINLCHMSDLLQTADVVLPMENPSIFHLCQDRLNITTPTYSNINRLIAHCWSNITLSMRFDGCLLANLEEFSTTLIPTPQFKIISSYLLPLIPIIMKSSQDMNSSSPSIYEMCTPLFNQLNTCFIHQLTPYKIVLSVCLLFRGENIIPKEIGQKLICELKQWTRFPDQIPTGFRCGINYHRPYIFNDQSNILTLPDKQVVMLTNQTTTSKYLCQRALNQKNDNSEQTEINEARNYLEEIKENYDKIEKEILHDNQLALIDLGKN